MDLGSLEIGEYREGDISEILSIEGDSFVTPWSESVFRSELVSPLSSILVARMESGYGKSVVGYVVYWRVAGEIHLHNIAVRPDLLRRGIASRLLSEVMRRSRQKGDRWVTLEVRQGNIPAQRMYSKFGFSMNGMRPRYYSDTHEDALIMWLDLEHITG